MPTLPAQPNLDQLRHQAKELLRAAKAGEPGALRRIEAVFGELTLTAAQLAVAREYGFASWARLKEEVEARTLAEKVDIFCRASIGGNTRRAARMLAETPAIAGYNFATAVILGDVARVRDELARDPSLATQVDPRTGWTALHVACSSRWYQLEPDRAERMLAVVELLLGAGADPIAQPAGGGDWRPLRCAIAVSNSGPSNRPVVELLLERGAVPGDEDLYLAGFAPDRHELLPLLLAHVPDVGKVAEHALAAPLDNRDTESTKLLLEAGADPRRYRDDDGEPSPIVWEAVRKGCDAEFLELLLSHEADPDLAGPDGRTPYRLATAGGKTEIAELLRRYGAADTATNVDRFLSACLRADRREAERMLAGHAGLLDRLTDDERAAIVRAAEAGDTAAAALMLDLGFPVETRGERGETALHVAAYAGSSETVQLLLDRGADVEAHDAEWDATPLDWASVGSGERLARAPHPDWPRTVRILLESGASTEEIDLSPDGPKQPSEEVASLLQAHVRGRKGPRAEM